MKSPSVPLALACAAACLAACAGPSRYYRTDLNARIAAYDYAGAAAEIEKAKKSEYGEKNAVLYHLDLGMVRHDAALYAQSEESFTKAEDRMEELFTKSVSRRAATFLLNDNTTKYAGEVFERALLNTFRALNYVFLGKTDDALVEARKVTAYLARFSEYMEGRSGWKDSAFAQYLAGMLFEQNGNADDARIAYAAAARAYERYGADYGTPAPEFGAPAYPELDAKGLGEIVFLHYNGPAPMKLSRTFQVAWNEAMVAVDNSDEMDEAETKRFNNALRAGVLGDAITVAYPVYVQDPFMIASSRVKAGEAEAESRLVEDISSIARQMMEEKNDAVRLRAIARAAVKFVLARAAAAEVEKQAGSGWGLLARVVTSATAAATEVADTRGWTTLPAQIRLARLAVPPGKQDVKITFVRADGVVTGTTIFRDVAVERGRRTYLHYRTAQ
ncbi:MAG TPA: hypothetical protein DCZ92_12325 [Elusimicrobia bacterium]|nr:MAG: hypothetical protein A2016_01005 [Elusimicrobia bacterium GWF2_62_30]HBA61575.1 hypothetical protein [Elusimicrobiota bacterium]